MTCLAAQSFGKLTIVYHHYSQKSDTPILTPPYKINDRTLPNTIRWLLIGLVIVSCILKLINVFNGPVHWDTNLYLNIAQGYFEKGVLTPPMWRYNAEWNIITGSGSGYGIFFLLGWVRIFGISVLSGHLFMFLVGLATLPVIYLLGTRWYGNRAAGLWAVAFFALSNTFATDYYVRMDSLSILATSSLLLMFLEIRKRDNLLLYGMLGLLSVAALEIHLLTIYCGIGFGLYTLNDYLQRGRVQKRWLMPRTPFVVFTTAGLIAAGVYALIHIAPNPTIYFEIPRLIMGDPTPRLWKEVYRWLIYSAEQPIVMMLLFALALLSAFFRRTQCDRLYLLFAACALGTFLILSPPYQVVYTGQLLPLFALGVAGLLVQGLDRKFNYLVPLRAAALIVFAITFAVRVGGTSFSYARAYAGIPYIDAGRGMTAEAYITAIDTIHARIDPRTVVMGAATYYVDLFAYHNYLSFWDGEIHGVGLRHETMLDFWNRERPRVFIGDATVNSQLIAYMQGHGGFTEVVPFLWIENALVNP